MKINKPNRVWFSLTGSCNNNCGYCYRNGSQRTVHLPLLKIQNFANTLLDTEIKKFTLIGGEPTLHPELYQVTGELLSREQNSCTIVTNGRRLDVERLKRVGPGRLHVTISLHGANPKHHLAVVGNINGYFETVSAIRGLSESGVPHSVNVVLSKESFPYHKEYIQLAINTKIRLLAFTLAIDSVDSCDYESDPSFLTHAVKTVHEACRESGLRHLFIASLPWCLLGKDAIEELFDAKQIMFNCPVDKGKSLVINEDGSLSICTHLSNMPIATPQEADFIMQDKKHFLDFWNQPELNSLWASVNVFRHPECVVCKFNTLCKGGCPLWWKTHDFTEVIQAL